MNLISDEIFDRLRTMTVNLMLASFGPPDKCDERTRAAIRDLATEFLVEKLRIAPEWTAEASTT